MSSFAIEFLAFFEELVLGLEFGFLDDVLGVFLGLADQFFGALFGVMQILAFETAHPIITGDQADDDSHHARLDRQTDIP